MTTKRYLSPNRGMRIIARPEPSFTFSVVTLDDCQVFANSRPRRSCWPRVYCPVPHSSYVTNSMRISPAVMHSSPMPRMITRTGHPPLFYSASLRPDHNPFLSRVLPTSRAAVGPRHRRVVHGHVPGIGGQDGALPSADRVSEPVGADVLSVHPHLGRGVECGP